MPKRDVGSESALNARSAWNEGRSRGKVDRNILLRAAAPPAHPRSRDGSNDSNNNNNDTQHGNFDIIAPTIVIDVPPYSPPDGVVAPSGDYRPWIRSADVANIGAISVIAAHYRLPRGSSSNDNATFIDIDIVVDFAPADDEDSMSPSHDVIVVVVVGRWR
mmetsp:Transcript_27806/g.66997  ORF Transcript_27806/g.66997 Transcript_27806/m.66997 type:complete len:161 (+) Transcript_27806:77-559(+)